MDKSLLKVFMKKDLKSYSIIIFLLLSLISGGTIILSIQSLNGSFRTDNIYAMYAYISRLFLMFFPVILWGTEFSNRTINLIKISGKNMITIYFMKFITYFVGVLIFMIFSYIEVWIYGAIFKVEIQLFKLLKNMFLAYVLYGFFLYGLGSLISMIVKNTTKSLIIIFLTNFFAVILCNILTQIGGILKKITEYIPFSYAENAFSFSSYSISQTINMLIYGVILNIIGCWLLQKRGVI